MQFGFVPPSSQTTISPNFSSNPTNQHHERFYSQPKVNQVLPINTHDLRKEEYKRMIHDKQQAALKRRSLENATDVLIANNRQPKTSLGHQPTATSGQLKQINKQKSVERDLVMEQAAGETHSYSQQKRTLAKTQSQHRLVLVSPESHIITQKGEGAHIKGSFADKSRGMNPTGQDPLFKQHLQYSNNTQAHNHQKNWQVKAAKMLSHLSSTKDCTYCNKTHAGIHSHSSIQHQHVTNGLCMKDSLTLKIQNELSKKYSTNRDYYNLKIVNDLIYNENTHIVSIFKDYLILDDINEFLKRSYNQAETKTRLPKLCSFYDKYSQVFPNYVILPESKYMFKNIQRKQKLIDEQYQIQEEVQRRQQLELLDEDRLFNSKFYNSVYKLTDLSMSRQQYEEQAKTIALKDGRSSRPTRIDQMRMDELVDRFLMKDSESNIQMITTTGLDFSGITHQSTFLQQPEPKKNFSPGPSQRKPQEKSSNSKTTAAQQMQQVKSIQAKNVNCVNSNNLVKKEPITKKPVQTQAITMVSNQATKKQKASFNQPLPTQKTPASNQVPKLDTVKLQPSNGSTKTTPRLQNVQEHKNPTIQTSPATKEALNAYLHQCHIDLTSEKDNLQIQILDSQETMLHSPQINFHSKQQPQTSMSTQQQLHSLSTANRQLMKSQQCLIPQSAPKDIANLKKNHRLSSGGGTTLGLSNSQQQFKVTPVHKKTIISPQAASLIPSRNQVSQGNTSSLQKSAKSTNSHAKYLSSGAAECQKFLYSQNEKSDFVQSVVFQSHSKKSENVIAQNKYKSGSSIGNHDQMIMIQQQEASIPLSAGSITGTIIGNIPEDYGDEEDGGTTGIADERFASPEIFMTNDDQGMNRRSVHQRQQVIGNPILLTSCDDNRVLSQCNNFDQIKKHLEQYITTTNTAPTEQSNHKKPLTFSNEKYSTDGGMQHYNKVHLTQSTDINNSRNGTNQKNVESLKQKIRGVFDVDANQNKTPNKASVIGKKSIMGQPTILAQGNNRMSIESKEMLSLMASSTTSAQQQYPLGFLSSTAAAAALGQNGRTLSFAQFQSSNNNQQYKSITSHQHHRKSSSSNKHNFIQESSLEAKRMSANRQSFKDLQALHNQERLKRCATGGGKINEATFGQINVNIQHPLSGTTTLGNPTFISSSSSNQKMYMSSNGTQQPTKNSQQAANTVRVMTPSYSLASLSKLISPSSSHHQTTSPMTVTLAANQKKQVTMSTHSLQQKKVIMNPSQLIGTSAQHHNFIISDKSSKVVNAVNNSKMSQVQQLMSKTSKLGANNVSFKPQENAQRVGGVGRLQQSSSCDNFQVTPRGMPPSQQIIPKPPQESTNLSCTISTENNSTAKAIETKHPKFMKTIEEYSQMQPHQYNTMLSTSIGQRKSGTGITSSISQAQFDLKAKQKVSTVVSGNQPIIKRASGIMGSQMTQSSSVTHFKSPSQQFQIKKGQMTKFN